MGILGREELENLKSLKQDLVGPIRDFAAEVGEDTVGDAKRFYTAGARKAAQNVRRAQEKAAQQAEALRREQAEMRRRRSALMKRAAITLVFLALFSLAAISLALYARAAEPDELRPGEVCLTGTLPDRANPEFGGTPNRTGELVTEKKRDRISPAFPDCRERQEIFLKNFPADPGFPPRPFVFLSEKARAESQRRKTT